MFRAMVDAAQWHANVQLAVKSGFPHVIAHTLNTVATEVQTRQVAELHKDFTLRNQYTERSLFIGKDGGRIWKADGAQPIARMNAVVGSRSPYLPLQETGGTKPGGAMPTTAGRGGDVRNVIPMTLRLRAMGAIAGGSKTLTAKGNRRRGKGFFILGPGPRLKEPGIFFRQPGGGGHQLLHVRFLRGNRPLHVKPTHWHTGPVKVLATYGNMNLIFTKAMRLYLAGTLPR